MKPYVIDSVQSTEGSVIEQYESENYGTLMSTSESSQLTKMMKAVVEEGTGYKLSGKNYSVAGKDQEQPGSCRKRQQCLVCRFCTGG